MSYDQNFYSLISKVENRHWWFLSRLSIIIWCLKEKVKYFNNFLEIGCGTGFVLKGIEKIFPNVDLHGSEYLEEGLKFARKRLPNANLIRLDVLLMEEHEQFDAIGAFDVLEHIEDDNLVLSNLYNAIKVGGLLMITVPQHKWLWSTADEIACHARRYSPKELKNKIEASGFEEIYSTSFVFFLLPFMFLKRLSLKFKRYDPGEEFIISSILNKILLRVMWFETLLMRLGITFPIGGSLLVIARK